MLRIKKRNSNETWNRLIKNFKVFKSVSPVIATVLLIALSIIAGLLVTITVLTILTIPQPIQVTIETPFDYKSNDVDVLIDSFRFGIRNDGDFAIKVLNPKASIKLLQNNAVLESWKVSVNESFVVNAKSSVVITMTTSSLPEQLNKNDKFRIVFEDAIIPLVESSDEVIAKTVTSRTFTVGDTYGPLKVTIMTNNATHLQVNVTNLGTLTLTLQITVSSATIDFVSETTLNSVILNSGESIQPTWEHSIPSPSKHIILLTIVDLDRGTLLTQRIITL